MWRRLLLLLCRRLRLLHASLLRSPVACLLSYEQLLKKSSKFRFCLPFCAPKSNQKTT
jgi:hypothetical protein